MNDLPKTIKRAVLLIALTAGLSLLYGVQHYALGGPLELRVTSEIHDLALNPRNSLIAAAAHDGTVRLWDIRNDWATEKLSGHDGPVVSVLFDRRGTVLFSAGRDGKIQLWDVDERRVERVLEAPGGKGLFKASLADESTVLAAIDEDGVIHVWDVETGEVRQSIGPTEQGGHAMALSADGTLVAASDGENIQIWDASTGEPIQRLEGYWEDEEAQEDWLGHEAKVTVLAFGPDGEILASGSADKNIVLWELESGEVKGIGEGHFATITELTFNDQGNTVLSGSADNKAKNWRVPGGKVSGTYVGHLSTVNGVLYGPDAQSILTGGDDGTLRMWDTINTSETRIEWTAKGMQPMWAKLFGGWMLGSGVVGLICAWGLWQIRRWSHLLTLTLYIIGPVVVLGLPLLETYFYPFSAGTKLLIAWPLLGLTVWYGALVALLLREQVTIFYDAPLEASLSEQLMTSQRSRQLRNGMFIGAVWILLLVLLFSILRRFNLDLAFMGHFFSFIMSGSGYTVLVSAASITLAVILALLGALGRLSGNPIANGVSGFYISLIRGTPLLVQIYIWYLGLPRLNIILSPLTAGILALGVNYGAYMTEIFRAGIQAIGKGQYEAAEALGMTRAQTLRRIVLPQAFRIVIPPIGNQFIAMMKDSSLVSIMAVWELSYRAQKIGRQYFRSLETFMIAAAFYWILTVIFQFLQSNLETYMARGERR